MSTLPRINQTEPSSATSVDTDYKHPSIQDLEFPQIVSEYLKHHTNRELADYVECIPSTIIRWANGSSRPMPGVIKCVMAYINKIRQEENW